VIVSIAYMLPACPCLDLNNHIFCSAKMKLFVFLNAVILCWTYGKCIGYHAITQAVL
jgi:hypothetical protein